jgi:hypothetical protein
VFVPGIDRFLRRGWPLAIAACLLVAASACGGRHIQLLFPSQNDSGDLFTCQVSNNVDAKPEHRQVNCVDHPEGFPPEVGNKGRVVHLDVRNCKVGEIRTITIMDADRANPTVYVTCGQSVSAATGPSPLTDLNGGLPSTTSAPPPAPANDLGGGLPANGAAPASGGGHGL